MQELLKSLALTEAKIKNFLKEDDLSGADISSNPNFKRWFKDSKVVDEYGNPLVVYHGTTGAIQEFITDVIWMTPHTKYSNEYTRKGFTNDYDGGNIMPLYASIQNPFEFPDKVDTVLQIKQYLMIILMDMYQGSINAGNKEVAAKVDEILAILKTFNNKDPIKCFHDARNSIGAALTEVMKKMGFDGYKQTEYGHPTYAAFNSSQVKSVFNNGEFNPNSAKISEEE